MITAGQVVLVEYAAGDMLMRNIALAVLRQLGFGGPAVAAVLGLTENYVATLHNAAKRDGPAALVGQSGAAAREVTAAQWDLAGRGGRRGQRRGDRAAAGGGAPRSAAAGAARAGAGPGGSAGRSQRSLHRARRAGTGPGPGLSPNRARVTRWRRGSRLPPAAGRRPALPAEGGSRPGMRGRCCCTRSSRGPAPGRCWAAAGGEPQDVALLTAVSMCFALGAATTEQFKHLAAAEAGPLAGLGALPGLRALRPELARIADRDRPAEVQRDVRVRDAGRGPGDLRRVLRR